MPVFTRDNPDYREILCIHPHAKFLDYSHDQLRTLVDLGATVEIHYAMTTEMMEEVAARARDHGLEARSFRGRDDAREWLQS